MEMFYDTKAKIREFVQKLQKDRVIDLCAEKGLATILDEMEPFRRDLRVIHRDLWKAAWAKLGLVRSGAKKEGVVAGKLDNLLLALHGFAVLFTLAAVIPVLIMYRRYTWIAAFLIITPLWHLYASRVLAGRLGDRERADKAHVGAGIFVFLPLLLLYGYFHIVFQIDFSPPLVPAAWLLYAVVLALVVRVRAALDLAIWTGIIFLNALLICQEWTPVLPALVTVSALFAMLLPAGAHLVGKRICTGTLDEYRAGAFVLMTYSLILSGITWFRHRYVGGLAGVPSWPFILFLLTFPLLFALARWEVLRLGGAARRAHCLVNMIGTWAFVAFAHYEIGPGRGHTLKFSGRLETIDLAFLGWAYLIVLSWSLWLFLGQIGDWRKFHENVFEAGTIGLGLCFLILLGVLFDFGMWYLSLPLSVGVLLLARRERRAVNKAGINGEEAPAENGTVEMPDPVPEEW